MASKRQTGIITTAVAAAVLIAVSAGSAGGGGGTAACAASEARAVSQPSRAQMAAAGLDKLPVAAQDRRVDLVAPPFSNPTNVTNPLFPISTLQSVVLNGKVDGKAFRTETTLVPETRVIEWAEGQCVKTLVSQYVAYLDGRIQEVALDFYAQADDGSVWYFGEDVYNYERGVVADTSGTWLAGKEGPAAMIMPADPKVGQVHRPENIPGLVWEEVAIKTIGKTVSGPPGAVSGAMVGRELHDDGTFSDKIFAPGYGEFFSGHEGDVEALAVAVPQDSAGAALPPELKRLSSGSADVGELDAAWRRYRRTKGVPPRLIAPMTRALRVLRRAVDARDRRRTRNAALDVNQAALDLELRYRTPAEIDRARFDLWARQVGVDAAYRNRPAVSGDVATLEWIRDRIANTLDRVSVTRVDSGLEELRANVADGDLRAAAKTASGLRRVVAR